MHKHLPEIITDFFCAPGIDLRHEKSIAILVFLLSLGISAQDVPQKGLLANPNTSGVVANNPSTTVNTEDRDVTSTTMSIKSRPCTTWKEQRTGIILFLVFLATRRIQKGP